MNNGSPRFRYYKRMRIAIDQYCEISCHIDVEVLYAPTFLFMLKREECVLQV